jgi:hypothetical protein
VLKNRTKYALAKKSLKNIFVVNAFISHINTQTMYIKSNTHNSIAVFPIHLMTDKKGANPQDFQSTATNLKKSHQNCLDESPDVGMSLGGHLKTFTRVSLKLSLKFGWNHCDLPKLGRSVTETFFTPCGNEAA